MCRNHIADVIGQRVVPALESLAEEVSVKAGTHAVVQVRRPERGLPWWGATFVVRDGPEFFEDVVLEVFMGNDYVQAEIVTDPGGRVWESAWETPFSFGATRKEVHGGCDDDCVKLSEQVVKGLLGFVEASADRLVAVINDPSWRNDPR